MPAAVPPGVIEALLARTGEAGTIDWSLSLSVGQAVRICDGPFTEFVGRLEHLDKAGRVRVLLDLMGRAVSVMTHADRVRPAN
jgi:transcriptional antiterminator RfaH